MTLNLASIQYCFYKFNCVASNWLLANRSLNRANCQRCHTNTSIYCTHRSSSIFYSFICLQVQFNSAICLISQSFRLRTMSLQWFAGKGQAKQYHTLLVSLFPVGVVPTTGKKRKLWVIVEIETWFLASSV